MRGNIIFVLVAGVIMMMIYSCQNHQDIEMAKYMSNGRDLYIARCQNCHGEKGEGLGLLTPPLTDTIFLRTNKNKLACMIKNGIEKPLLIHGKPYEGKMPAFSDLQAIDITQIVVYITNSFGNNQGMYSYDQASNDLKSCN